MKYGIKIEVAGICVGIRINIPPHDVFKNYIKFISSSTPVFHVDLNIVDKFTLNISQRIGGLAIGRRIEVQDEHFRADIDLIKNKGNAIADSKHIFQGLDTLARNIFAILLLKKYNGIVLHAACVLKGRKAYIFIGPSGSGKTTVANLSLSKGYTILNDDIVMIRKIRGDYFVFPTPAWMHMQEGRFENRPYPIGGVFILKKDKKIYLKSISQGTALAEIFSILNIIPLNFFPIKRTLHRFSDFINKYGLNELHFRKDMPFWSYI